jgi:UDP-N-acetylmuramoyl-tripeptide--D-alanyl-D-alanine ligase
MNALAAAAVATVFEMAPGDIGSALATARPPKMRGEVFDFAAGFTVVDDSYNSNPRSLLNMVRTMVEGGQDRKRRIVIAGEMLELGPDEAQLHYETGQQIAAAGVDVVWGVRGLAERIVAGARDSGITEARFLPDSKAAAAAILNEVNEGDLILIKGSRGVATDKIVAEIRRRFPLLGEDERA